jgi:ER-bound oxygenase mpaB/B'/Rubber oxygenase, catalytic domain
MRVQRWTDEFLEKMRQQCDPPADDAVGRLFQQGKVPEANSLMKLLVANEQVLPETLPAGLREYFEQSGQLPPWVDRELLRAGEGLFTRYGPQALVALLCASLPSCYAAARIAQVLHLTVRLESDPFRRILETSQMVIDVMAPGGLEPGGYGLRSAQKVRLMHAAIRHLIRRSGHWNPEWGQPINQEDLAGTLMTFAFVVPEGLKALRIDLTDEQQQAWLYVWRAVGRIIGVDERLIPADMDEARELTHFIRERQVAYSKEGVAMTAALIEGFQQLTPDLLDGLPASMVHFFLDQDQWKGSNVANLLEVPRPDWTVIIPHAIKGISAAVDWVGDNTFVAARLLRYVSKDIVEGMLLVERGGQRTPFYIPDHLQDLWRLKPGTRSADRENASNPKVA